MMIYMNGHYVDSEKAAVSVYDHGFLYGIGLFETVRTYGGVPFLWKEHLQRLEADCRRLLIDYSPDAMLLQEAVCELLKLNQLTEAYIRLSVSAGSGAIGLQTGPYEEPNVIIYVKPLPPASASFADSDRALQLLELSRNTPEAGIRMKSFHYMNNIMAKRELGRYSWAHNAEGLLLDNRGFLAEGMVSNLFFIKGDCGYTPDLDTGILPGVTRSYVMKLAGEFAFEIEEGHYTWEQLVEADEIFLTNSIQEIVPVSTLYDREGNKHKVGQGIPGPVTARLYQAYQQGIREICGNG